MRIDPCILGTVCVPWDDDFGLAEEIFRRQVRLLLGAGLGNLYVFGTAGEGYAVTDAMFRRVATVFHEEMRASTGLCQLGVIGLSVAQVKERIDAGLEIGFRMFQISLPSWGALNGQEMYGFFNAVLGAYPEAQFLHYNTPRGLRVITGREYARIAADHPNLVATKSGGTSMTRDLELLTRAPELCHFMTEFDFAYASLFGRCGLLASLSTVSPQRCHELFAAGQRADAGALVEMTRKCAALRDLVLGSLDSGQHMDGAYDKLYAKLADPEFPLRLLPPYQAATDEEFRAFAERLRAQLPEWR